MRTLMLSLLLLAACQGRDSGEGNEASAQRGGSAAGSSESEPGEGSRAGGGKGGAPLRLTGLWEAGAGPRKSQLCMTGEGDEAEFALILSQGGATCAGAGKAARAGDRLTFEMAGDRKCQVSARLEGSAIVLPGTAPPDCSYYCSEGGRLAGIRFERAGSTRADAMKARDPAGDPLCG